MDIRIFLDADDIVKAVRIVASENQLLRLRLKAELAAMDYDEAASEAKG